MEVQELLLSLSFWIIVLIVSHFVIRWMNRRSNLFKVVLMEISYKEAIAILNNDCDAVLYYASKNKKRPSQYVRILSYQYFRGFNKDPEFCEMFYSEKIWFREK